MRFQHIDIAKGIGILLVIALHTDFHQEWMTTFEMPLFFLLSGLFVKIDMPFREYAIKKINTLLVPYIFFESPKLIYDAYFACRHDQISFLESYINSSLPTANWFLLAMFISQIMCYFILRLCRRNMWKIIVAFAAFGIGYALSLFKIPNYLFAGSAITLSSFLLLGNVFRNLIIVPFISGIFKPLLYGGVCLLVCFAVWEFQPSFIFYRSNIIEANMFLAFFMALIGSGGNFCFCGNKTKQNIGILWSLFINNTRCPSLFHSRFATRVTYAGWSSDVPGDLCGCSAGNTRS